MVDYNREGQVQAAKDGGDSRMVMMDGAAEDGCDEGLRQRRTTTVEDDNSTQDWATDYDGEGQEWAARDGRDSRVAMMAVAAEESGGGQQWWRRTTTTKADNNGSG